MIFLAGIWCGPQQLLAESWIGGTVRVIDGDTIDVGAARIRLYGIDAPETDQTCQTEAGRTWACGAWVRDETKVLFDGATARCIPLTKDRYGRIVARCETREGDMAQRLVSLGFAVAYRRYALDYVADEERAARQEVGLHRGSFQAPALFRKTRNSGAGAQPPDGGCRIKGNISGNGTRIYHQPGQRDYEKTTIRTDRGERWFCSAREAQAAGWRPARR